MTRLRETWAFLKRVYAEFGDDNVGLLSAALAFYTGLSVAPMLVLFLWVAGLLGPDAQQAIQDEVQGLIGEQAGSAIGMIIKNAEAQPGIGSIASLMSMGVLLFAAIRVFTQLQLAMNLIWDVEAKPGQGFKLWVRKRLISLGMLASLGFLLVVSLVMSAGLALLSGAVTTDGSVYEVAWQVMNFCASGVVFFLAFAAVFRFLPDVVIAWRDVWVGAAFTAILFSIGKLVIGQYLGRTSLGSSYGAAGALVVFLLWVYYSSLTMFIGAEFTQVWAHRRGDGIEPEEHAQRIEPASEER